MPIAGPGGFGVDNQRPELHRVPRKSGDSVGTETINVPNTAEFCEKAETLCGY